VDVRQLQCLVEFSGMRNRGEACSYIYDCLVVLQKANDYQPYPMDQVRHISYQLCKAVSCT